MNPRTPVITVERPDHEWEECMCCAAIAFRKVSVGTTSFTSSFKLCEAHMQSLRNQIELALEESQ